MAGFTAKEKQQMHCRTSSLRSALCAFLAALALAWRPAPAAAQTPGFVYVATNESAGNAVLQFYRARNGALTPIDEAFTGGSGNGLTTVDPLASQDSLVLSPDGLLLLVVNAGSDQVSSLSVDWDGLHLVSTVSSKGTFPNSIALRGDLVYVLNAHGTPNITGFRLVDAGKLIALSGSTRDLPGGSMAAPHDIHFSPDGTR